MIYIFHGDNQLASRSALNQFIDQSTKSDILRLDSKDINHDLINNFLNSPSLFQSQKILIISNLFSVLKGSSNETIKLIQNDLNNNIIIWQNKSLTPTQIKLFPKAKINHFPLNKVIFSCLNQIKPKNTTKFISLYQKVIKQEPFELFLFFVKNNLRKQLTSYSYFNKKELQKTYLQLIELDFQSKTGKLVIPKEIALQRILTYLLN